MQPNKINMNEMDYGRWMKKKWKKKWMEWMKKKKKKKKKKKNQKKNYGNELKKKKKKKEIKTKHDQWSVDWRKSDETWTIMKYEFTEMRWKIKQWNR